jgi:hypothetical protein
MQTEQGNIMLSLQAAQEFLDRHPEKLDGVLKTGARQRLDEIIAVAEGHAAQQVGSAIAARGATQAQAALRTALLQDHMAPIARIAKVDLPRTPQLKPLLMPSGRPTIQRLAAAASGMAEAAAPHTDVFVGAGLSVDFIAKLNGAADALVASLTDRVQSRGQVKEATRGLKAKLAAGRKIVHVIDAFVKTALKDDPALLAAWALVMRVRKTQVHSKVAGPGPTPAPTGSTGTPASSAPAAPGTPAGITAA